MRLVLSVGESSGDYLGAHLAAKLKQHRPDIELAGLAGPLMAAQGVKPWFGLDSLNVMGLQEVIGHLPRLIRLRRDFRQHIIDWQPDAFIGIDAPDFNLGLAKQLKARGVPTLHYVSPSVWAWRSHRLKTLAKQVDALMTLFPFEPKLYEPHGLDTTCVGHPLADDIENTLSELTQQTDPMTAGPTIALLPGSRNGELDRHTALLMATARLIRAHHPEAHFIMPLVHADHVARVHALCGDTLNALDVEVLIKSTRQALARSDVAINASGTVTLETFLMACPQVVFYRLAPVTHWIARSLRLVKTTHVALPNILTEQPLVPEFIQDHATPEALTEAALAWLSEPRRVADYQRTATQWRARLAADDSAAKHVLAFIEP